ncbi:MAG: hypothetical protein NVS1B6_08130 [Steroidobacteraceae bacterium]
MLHYDANIFTSPAPWGPLVILVPVLGAIGVMFLVTNFAPEAKGHGVPEVMDAIYHKCGVIRPVVALVKSLASALAIGSGSSVGREGPIIQIGSALGSTLGQIVRMPAGHKFFRRKPVSMTIYANPSMQAVCAMSWSQGSALLQPLAIAIISGLIAQLPLVLIVLPAGIRVIRSAK